MNLRNINIRELLSSLKYEFISKVNVEKYIDLQNLLRTLRDQDKVFLRQELKLYLAKYHSNRMLKHISILIHSAILIKYFNSSVSDVKELQGLIESFIFVDEFSYPSVKNYLISMTIHTFKDIIEKASSARFLLVIDSALRQLQHIESIKEKNLQIDVEHRLYDQFINTNLKRVSSEFIEFNRRYQASSENILKRVRTENLRNFPYLSNLKISDNCLRTSLEAHIAHPLANCPSTPIETGFKIKKFEIPHYTEIININDYQIRAPMSGIKEKSKSKKYFFKVLVDEELGLVLKAIQYKCIDNSEYHIFNMIENDHNLSLPKIRALTYVYENVDRSSYESFRSSDGLRRLNVLKFFFENFDILENHSIEAEVLIKNLNQIITTLEVLNKKNLRVPILFLNSFGIASDKIVFSDFQNVQTSDEEAFSFEWLKYQYEEYFSWLKLIGVDDVGINYSLETLQCWCLAAIFKVKIKSIKEDVERIFDVLSEESVKFRDVRACLPDERTCSLISMGQSSCSLNSN